MARKGMGCVWLSRTHAAHQSRAHSLSHSLDASFGLRPRWFYEIYEFTHASFSFAFASRERRSFRSAQPTFGYVSKRGRAAAAAHVKKRYQMSLF
jgi:hypothetical protein